MSGVRGGAVGWGTSLQVRRSWFRFPMVSLEFFIDIILSAALWPWGLTQPLTVPRADNLTIFMCGLSWNLWASTSWNPLGLSRPVMGLLYLYLFLSSLNRENLNQVWQRSSCFKPINSLKWVITLVYTTLGLFANNNKFGLLSTFHIVVPSTFTIYVFT